MSIVIREARAVDDRLVEAVDRLLPQLSPRLEKADVRQLSRLVADPSSRLLVAEEQGRVVGMLSLVWYDVPSGRKGWVEDVVTDAAVRGRGVGRQLVRRAVELAAENGVGKLMLTSSAHRVAAHALYRSENFEVADTTLFARKIQ